MFYLHLWVAGAALDSSRLLAFLPRAVIMSEKKKKVDGKQDDKKKTKKHQEPEVSHDSLYLVRSVAMRQWSCTQHQLVWCDLHALFRHVTH